MRLGEYSASATSSSNVSARPSSVSLARRRQPRARLHRIQPRRLRRGQHAPLRLIRQQPPKRRRGGDGARPIDQKVPPRLHLQPTPRHKNRRRRLLRQIPLLPLPSVLPVLIAHQSPILSRRHHSTSPLIQTKRPRSSVYSSRNTPQKRHWRGNPPIKPVRRISSIKFEQ